MLKLQNLTKKYADTPIFQNISLEIPVKSIVSLTGKNGIGKTTLLNMLGGISSYSGEVWLEDINMERNFRDYMDITTLIPNTPFLYDYLTVSEMIDLAISLSEQKKNDSIVKELMTELMLFDYQSVLIKNLSLGTKQKVAFVIAFLDSPKFILIDEPFVNFDRLSFSNLLKFIYNYVMNTDSIIIFSTHSVDSQLHELVTHNIDIFDSKTINLSRKN